MIWLLELCDHTAKGSQLSGHAYRPSVGTGSHISVLRAYIYLKEFHDSTAPYNKRCVEEGRDAFQQCRPRARGLPAIFSTDMYTQGLAKVAAREMEH